MKSIVATFSVLALLMVVSPGRAPATGSPAFYKISAANQANVNTLSFSHDVGTGSNRFLVVSVVTRDGLQHASSVSFNNVGLTRVSQDECKITSVTPQIVFCSQEVWTLVNPPAGTHQVRVNLVGPSPRSMAKATSYTGVNQVTPIGPISGGGGVGPGSPPGYTSIFPFTAPGDLVYSTFATGGDDPVTIAPGAGQTQRGVMYGTPPVSIGVGDKRASSGLQTEMRWTYSSSGTVVDTMTAFALKPAN